MKNINKNKYEDFASYFHNEEEIELTDDVCSNVDFKATQKIFNLQEKVVVLAHLTQVEDAWKKVGLRLKEKNSFWISRNLKTFRYAAIFIVLVALAGIAGIILFQSPQNAEMTIFTEIITSRGEMKEVLLPDGSKVWIGANSILKFDNGFGKDNREIIFNGEAMFDVEKDAMLSFLVKLDDASVKVHGTKFLVTGYSTGIKNEIVLLKGKVEYFIRNKSFLLSPGERIIDNFTTGKTIKDRIELGNYKEWVNGKIYFDNSELDNLTFLLEQWYEAKFTFGNESLKNYKFTGVIDKRESLDYNLNIISLTNKVKFQKNEHGIVVINN